MPDNWEKYKEWKELMEDIRKRPQEEDTYNDDVEDLNKLFREYID